MYLTYHVKALWETNHSVLLFLYHLKQAPVKVGSAVVGAMDCVLIANEGVPISEQLKKINYTMILTKCSKYKWSFSWKSLSWRLSELIPDIGTFPKTLKLVLSHFSSWHRASK